MQFTFQTSDGQAKTLALTPQADGSYLASLDGRTYHVHLRHAHEDALLLEINGQKHLIHAAQDNGIYYLALNGRTLTLQKAAAASVRSLSKEHGGDLKASMPGQVTQILVAAGDAVQKGQTLILLEAMKMELRVKAPQDGRVRAVLCVVGQAVERGQLLVELE